jgi:hypothetical protein
MMGDHSPCRSNERAGFKTEEPTAGPHVSSLGWEPHLICRLQRARGYLPLLHAPQAGRPLDSLVASVNCKSPESLQMVMFFFC